MLRNVVCVFEYFKAWLVLYIKGPAYLSRYLGFESLADPGGGGDWGDRPPYDSEK